MTNINLKIKCENFDYSEILKFVEKTVKSLNINRKNSTFDTYSENGLFAVLIKNKNILSITVDTLKKEN